MSNNDTKELELIDISLVTTALFIFSLLVSMSIIFDERQDRLNRPRLYNEKDVPKISIANKWLIVALSIIFVYINYTNAQVVKENGGDVNDLNWQTFASILAFIAAVISLYVAGEGLNASDIDIVDFENPEL